MPQAKEIPDEHRNGSEKNISKNTNAQNSNTFWDIHKNQCNHYLNSIKHVHCIETTYYFCFLINSLLRFCALDYASYQLAF